MCASTCVCVCVSVYLSHIRTQMGMGWEEGRVMLGLGMK